MDDNFDISKMYDEIISQEQEAINKVAEDTTENLDPDFLSKLASGDEEATAAVEAFIEESRANGVSDEDIEAALMSAVGGEEAGADEEAGFEDAKQAAYIEGAEKAIEDALTMAKEAGYDVDVEDLAEYELGLHYGAGYMDTRAEVDEAIQKIAADKGRSAREMASAVADWVKSKGQRYGQLMAGGKKRGSGVIARRPGNKARRAFTTAEGLKATGARVGTAGAAGAAGYGGYRAMRDKK